MKPINADGEEEERKWVAFRAKQPRKGTGLRRTGSAALGTDLGCAYVRWQSRGWMV